MKIKRRFKQGAQSISNGLAKVIGWENIRLKSPVSLIDQSGDHTVVVTDDGLHSKLFKSPFWRKLGFSGEAVSDNAPITLLYDTSPPDADELAKKVILLFKNFYVVRDFLLIY